MAALEGKRILVTGGSRGLGKAFCLRFAKSGADIAFTYASNEKAAEETLQEIKSHGHQALAYKVSVLDFPGLTAMVAELEKDLGPVDVLVNNAGVSQALPLALMDEPDWDSVLDTNVKGPYFVTRSVIRGMIRRRSGVILNIGSLAGVKMIEAPIHYCTSKAAMKGFTESLAKELSRYKIRVNCLAPGLLEDGVARHLPEYKLQDLLSQLSLRRKGTLAEIARCAEYLVSDRSNYMTGATIIVDGGL